MIRTIGAIALVVVLAGCRPSATLLEREDLVSLLHNKETDYTLIVYLRPDGFERRVVRHAGELVMMIERRGGEDYVLIEPGLEPRRLDGHEVMAQMARMDALVFGNPEEVLEGQTPAREVPRSRGGWRST